MSEEILNPNEVAVVRVALPKNLRNSGKTFGKIKHFTLGRATILADNAKMKLGNQGVMTKEDWEAKNFVPYGLKEYFDTEGKAQMAESVKAENSKLQDEVMGKDAVISEKDAEIEALKAQLAELEKSESVSTDKIEPSTDNEYSGKKLPELKEIAAEKGIDITGLKKEEIISKLLEHAGN